MKFCLSHALPETSAFTVDFYAPLPVDMINGVLVFYCKFEGIERMTSLLMTQNELVQVYVPHVSDPIEKQAFAEKALAEVAGFCHRCLINDDHFFKVKSEVGVRLWSPWEYHLRQDAQRQFKAYLVEMSVMQCTESWLSSLLNPTISHDLACSMTKDVLEIFQKYGPKKEETRSLIYPPK